MIYCTESVYTKIKDGPNIENEEHFFSLCKPVDGEPTITDDMLKEAFSGLRLSLGQHFKLDRVSFLMGNGCSIYAGSQSTTVFKMDDVINADELEPVRPVIEKIKEKTMEEQLNDLLTVQQFYQITEDGREKAVAAIIGAIKRYLLNRYVNSVNYAALRIHEAMVLKLRSFGCLGRVSFFTPNYDLAIEYTLDKLGIEYANGFSGFINRKFDPKALQMGNTTKLIKVHGSVSWVFNESEKTIKEVQPVFTDDGTIVVPDDEHILIYPTSQKLYQTYNAPYSELMRNMLDCFESKRNVIIVLGYRYSDEHVNEILFKALANPDNIFYFFDYDGGSCDFIQRMKRVSADMHNINIFLGKFLGDFETFVKYILPANAEMTDDERIIDLLYKAMEKRHEGSYAE